MDAIWSALRLIGGYVRHFGPQEWLLSFLAAVAIGVLCMRGFGSRSGY